MATLLSGWIIPSKGHTVEIICGKQNFRTYYEDLSHKEVCLRYCKFLKERNNPLLEDIKKLRDQGLDLVDIFICALGWLKVTFIDNINFQKFELTIRDLEEYPRIISSYKKMEYNISSCNELNISRLPNVDPAFNEAFLEAMQSKKL